MATLLDSLFFSIGWDTKDFDRGKRSVDKGFRDTKESAHKEATEIEAAGRRAAGFFRSLRNETAGLILTFAGASSLKGFLGDIIDTAAGTDRLAKNMGVARNELYAWQNLLKSNGGSPGDATAALQTMANQIQARKLGVQTGNEANLMGLGVTPGDMTSPDAMLLKIAQASQGMDRATYSARLGMLGFSPEMIDLMARGRGELQKQLEVQRKQAEITDKDVQEARKFQEAWANITTTIKGQVTPYLTMLLEGVDGLFKNTGAANIVLPVLIGLIGAVGASAAIANLPVLALAAGIAAVVAGYATWKSLSPDEKKEFYDRRSERWSKMMGQLGQGDVSGAFGTFWGGIGNAADLLTGDKSSLGGAPGGAGKGVSGLFSVLEARYGTARARGIWAGIGAESGWNPNAFNSAGGGQGAYGLGQWRGTRLKALRAQYGDKNGRVSAANQIAFMMAELEGGGQGGASVLNSRTAGEALSNYVGLSAGRSSFGFMRPDMKGRAGDLARGGQILNIGAINITSPDPNAAGRDVVRTLGGRNIIINSASGLSQ